MVRSKKFLSAYSSLGSYELLAWYTRGVPNMVHAVKEHSVVSIPLRKGRIDLAAALQVAVLHSQIA